MYNQLARKKRENYLEQAKRLSCDLTLPESVSHGSKHSNDSRILAVTLYIIIGRLAKVAEIMGISRFTLNDWRKTEWWAQLTTNLHTTKHAMLNARVDGLINQALDNIEDRLTTGEYATYDSKRGETIFKPVCAKDNAMIFGILFDKQRINNALPTSITQTTHTHLLDIKQQFEQISGERVIENNIE